ncbi:MAG TPA: alpha/beta hydrolase [Amycolatopsis sp.]|nr:alpha/beta hydrolase [Amycolatopsis sp.]
MTFDGGGGARLTAYRWDPVGEPTGVVQLAHGMGEHMLRYEGFAEALTAAGLVVYGHDHRGHGASATSPDALGVLGPGGWLQLVEDMYRFTVLIRGNHPGLPAGLVAHSMGSFAAQQYLLDHSAGVDAVVLTGTSLLDQLEPAFDLDQPLDLAALNAPFEPARTGFDWLSRDEAVVDAYLADPKCGFGLDLPATKEMFAAGRRMADERAVAAIRHDLPVALVSGDQDPINGQGALLHLLAQRLRDAGLTDVTLRLYPGARHEVLNETNRDEVVAGIIEWLKLRLG